MMEIERPKIETAALSPDGRYGKFVVEPLERGFGTVSYTHLDVYKRQASAKEKIEKAGGKAEVM